MHQPLFRAAAVAASLTLLLTAASAVASPGSGISPPSTRGDGVIRDGFKVNTPNVVKLQSDGDLRVFDQELTIGPLGHTGWHRHPGPVLVTVVSGTFQMQYGDCSTVEYEAGKTVVDTGELAHRGINPSATASTSLSITYLVPAGGPLRIEADPVAC